MSNPVRQDILDKLSGAPAVAPKARPVFSIRPVLPPDREELIERFAANVEEQTGVVHRVSQPDGVKAVLLKIARELNISTVISSTDDTLLPLNLPNWGKDSGLEIITAEKFTDREDYREWIFNKAQAGITGADYGIAESGTICLVHNRKQPRLISIAPLIHIALLPVERIVSVYEEVLESLYADSALPPAHISLITGPSMTADIQGGQFRGMHGPGRLYVILIGE